MFPVVRARPSYKTWKTGLIKERETLEMKTGCFGNVEIRGGFDHSEFDEGFIANEEEYEKCNESDDEKPCLTSAVDKEVSV